MQEGHDIGIDSPPKRSQFQHNPKMDLQSNIKTAQTIKKWYGKGYLMGPYPKNHPIAKECRINPVFSVPKPDGTVRPVVNYSKKIDGKSLNESLREEWCTVEYLKIQEIVYTISCVGKGAVIWAKDLEDGYFNVKIHPSQTKLISFIFMGLLFIPIVLVFGLSSAPLIFTVFMWYVVSAIRLADPALTFLKIPKEKLKLQHFQQEKDIVYCGDFVKIPLILFYLDDIFGINSSEKIQRQYHLAKNILLYLGLNAKQAKDRPPSTVQIMLGLEYDTIKQEVRTPKAKGLRYIAFAYELLAKRSITKKQLFSLTGKVRHASGQCRPLNAFARGVEIHGHKIKYWHHYIHLNNRLKKDIQLMIDGLYHSLQSGVPFSVILGHRDIVALEAFVDATGSHGGIGGYIHTDIAPFFQVDWGEIEYDVSGVDIQWKEMVAIFVVLDVFKSEFRNKFINIWSDNEPVVWMLIKWRSSLDRPDLQIVIREIARICIFNNINPWWNHIEGDNNKVADRLSRFKRDPFKKASITAGKNHSTRASSSLKFICQLCGL